MSTTVLLYLCIFAFVKRIAVIFLVLGIFSVPLKNHVLLLTYHLTKSYITENFCINKDKKELKCNGKCHLNDYTAELEDNSEKEAGKIPLELMQYKEISLYKAADIALPLPQLFEQNLKFQHTNQIKFFDLISKLLRPPNVIVYTA